MRLRHWLKIMNIVLEGGKDICRQGTESDIKKILNIKSYEVGVDEE